MEIVRNTWERHLTPTEVASLADKASQQGDQALVREAAHLALSVLPKAYALTAVESQKALNQCKEQSSKLLAEACLAVEKAAEKDGVYPEVLFKVARHWYNLHLEVKAKHSCESSANHQLNFLNYPPPTIMPQPLPSSYYTQFYATAYQQQMSNFTPRLHVSHSAPDLPQQQFQPYLQLQPCHHPTIYNSPPQTTMFSHPPTTSYNYGKILPKIKCNF